MPKRLVFEAKRSSDGRDLFQCQLQCNRPCGHLTKSGTPCRCVACIGVPLCWRHTLQKYHVKVIFPSTLGAAAGKGLFAWSPQRTQPPPGTLAFDTNDLIVPYGGEIVPHTGPGSVNARYGTRVAAPYAVRSNTDRRSGDAACRRGIGAMANHRNPDSNANIVYRTVQNTPAALRNYTGNVLRPNSFPPGEQFNRFMVYATRPIYYGEEIFINYGNTYNVDRQGIVHTTKYKSV